MASNGMKRLREKHVKKGIEADRLNAMLDELMGEAIDDSPVEKPRKKTKNSVKKVESPEITPTSQVEKDFFDKIWSKLQDIHDDPEPYRLTALNLAHLYAQNKRLEEQMEMDGGAILSAKSGQLYTHPAAKLIQGNNAQILLYHKALGMSIQGASVKKKDSGPNFISSFAQFQ